MKRIIPLLLLPVFLLGCSVYINGNSVSVDTCRYSTTRQADVAVDGATLLEVNARSGNLTIRGQEGLTDVRVEGRACASSPQLLEQISYEAGLRGESVRVDVHFPERIVNGSASLDLEIMVPASMTARVDAASGRVVIENLLELDLQKRSGDLDIRQIGGDLRVTTTSGTASIAEIDGALTYDGGSGDLDIQDVTGQVRIDSKSSGSFRISGVREDIHLEDIGSGNLTIRDVGGSVTVREKSSGTVTISDVSRSVELVDLGSGTLNVDRVKGDLIVRSKGSGSINQSGVEGLVQLPNR